LTGGFQLRVTFSSTVTDKAWTGSGCRATDVKCHSYIKYEALDVSYNCSSKATKVSVKDLELKYL